MPTADRAPPPRRPTATPEIVLSLKTAGAIVLGKVHTTEFAFFDPPRPAIPMTSAHTPGGSSSGSAAAVAAGMAPAAVGTQTVASVNRPAAYCGISAFSRARAACRPTASRRWRLLRHSGLLRLERGGCGLCVRGRRAPFVTMRHRLPVPATLSVCIPDDPHIADAIPEMKAALTRFADALASAGHAVARPASPISFERLFNLQRSTMAYEAGRALRHLLQEPAQHRRREDHHACSRRPGHCSQSIL